ncbi:MAG: cupin domain-containing protein [Planctomycetia bacterium]|nr:cupin domain-containing protein [Planctomycetia bacterium]
MNELDKGLELALTGPEADAALAAMHAQLAAWGLTVPPVEPLVLDFGLDDFPRVGLIEYWLANEIEAGYCGKYLFVADGQTCPTHHHRRKHETFFVVKGRVEMTLDGAARALGEGELLAVPPGVAHRFTGVGPALLLELSMPCVIDDNYFENRDIPIGGNYRGGSHG